MYGISLPVLALSFVIDATVEFTPAQVDPLEIPNPGLVIVPEPFWLMLARRFT